MLADTLQAIEDSLGGRRNYALVTASRSLVRDEQAVRISTGWSEIDRAFDGGLAVGLHEWVGVATPNVVQRSGSNSEQVSRSRRSLYRRRLHETRRRNDEARGEIREAPGGKVPGGGERGGTGQGRQEEARGNGGRQRTDALLGDRAQRAGMCPDGDWDGRWDGRWDGFVGPGSLRGRRAPEGGEGAHGFAGACRRDVLWCPPLSVLTSLAQRALALAQRDTWVVWIGRRVAPYPRTMVRPGALSDAGVEGGDRLLKRSLFVFARDVAARVWASDLALRSPAVQAVIVDGSTFDMAQTRRLHLLAKARDKWVLAARPPGERGQLSAAATRWHLMWEPSTNESSSTEIDPCWRMSLIRGVGVPFELYSQNWLLEWNHATDRLDLSAAPSGATRVASSPSAVSA